MSGSSCIVIPNQSAQVSCPAGYDWYAYPVHIGTTTIGYEMICSNQSLINANNNTGSGGY